ncbi:MAG: saccharopine dehydrogenase NADP-binding domain-containing protein [Bacteroidetes bacterium]|nr:saccharopine dehydrogenase NADP-binding domain-containing protein [Bacteroidota bacterium]
MKQTLLIRCRLAKWLLKENCCINCRILFIHYGIPVVEACIQEGTHYLDITGEPVFVSNVLKDYDVLAKEKGVLIINCCGFDSIPADLGAFFTLKQFEKPKSGYKWICVLKWYIFWWYLGIGN